MAFVNGATGKKVCERLFSFRAGYCLLSNFNKPSLIT